MNRGPRLVATGLHHDGSVAVVAAIVPWLVIVAGGCGDTAAVRPGDIRSYEVARPPAPEPRRSLATEARGGLRLRYTAPEGWSDRGGSGLRLATLVINAGEEEKGYEVTVIPASGSLRSNLDRWLGQLEPGLPPEELKPLADDALAAARAIAVGEAEATIVLLEDRAARAASDADGEAILAAMIPVDGGASLFVKFKGPAAVARREQEAFSRFVSSIRWN